MNAYTMSRLAFDAGLSVHIVRGYLLRPVACTPGGYGVRRGGLQRLCFVREAFEAGIGLNALARLCRALDTADSDQDFRKTLKGLESTVIDAEISPLWSSLALTAARVERCGNPFGGREARPRLRIVYKEFPSAALTRSLRKSSPGGSKQGRPRNRGLSELTAANQPNPHPQGLKLRIFINFSYNPLYKLLV